MVGSAVRVGCRDWGSDTATVGIAGIDHCGLEKGPAGPLPDTMTSPCRAQRRSLQLDALGYLARELWLGETYIHMWR